MKKSLLIALAILLATATSVATYKTVNQIAVNTTTDKAVSVTTNNTSVTKQVAFDTPAYTNYLKTLSIEQLQELFIETSSSGIVKRSWVYKPDTSLHVGNFSQVQLPETTVGFYPRAYTPTTVQAFASTAAPTGRRPAEIYYAYGIDKITSKGEGQTVAIVVPAGSETLVNDLNTYSAYFGLPNATVSFIYPQGVPTVRNDGWALETTLDATMVHMIAPKAKILMVICNTSAISGLVQGIDAAVAAGAKIISLSWGSVEWSNQFSYSSHLNVPGVVFTSATGDSGYGTSWPSTEAGVIAVGGTQLVSSGTSGTVVEQVWYRSGGGISKFYARPSWQSKVQSTTFRTVPDLSINASGYTIYMSSYNSQKGYLNTTGTSASSPIIAGLIALGYSTRTSALPADIHPTLYTNSSLFIKDIIGGTTGTGANIILGTAVAGYDYATGLGVPNAPAFVNALTK